MLCTCGRVVFLLFYQPFGILLVRSRGRAWEGRGDAFGQVSEKRRNNSNFKAVLAAPWDPCGASGRPLIFVPVPLGALWMICFIVFPNHALDCF